MTAHSMEGNKQACLKAGMNDYISKPFKSVSLKEIVDSVLEV
jgi:CheY-like chemotaxis protein